jgi:Ca2+-binding RTX toxin-like protein
VVAELGNVQDTDAADTHTFLIVDGAGVPFDHPDFEIIGNQLVVKAGHSLTLGIPVAETVIVQVDDGNGGTFNQMYSFSVNLYDTSFGGSAERDLVLGSSVAETLSGGDGHDWILAGAGDDTLNGGAGRDLLEGGLGADTLIGGAGYDYASYHEAAAAVTVDLFNSSNNTGEAFGDTYLEIEAVKGSDFSDSLFGDNSANWIYGCQGDDTIVGRGGNDTLIGGMGNDLYILADGDGNDRIWDFVAGAGSEDQLDISAFGYADLAAVQAASTVTGNGVTIQLDADDSVYLNGVASVLDLHQDDFII